MIYNLLGLGDYEGERYISALAPRRCIEYFRVVDLQNHCVKDFKSVQSRV